METEPMIQITSLAKTFTLHNQGGVSIPVFDDVDLRVDRGECVVLFGPSGSGKSTLLRSIYGNYKPDKGQVTVLHEGQRVDIVSSVPQIVLQVRRSTMGYVSQFLRVIPRVSTLDVVSEPLRALGVEKKEARERAAILLEKLNIPKSLWDLAPATFSGGEQQRVNIARGFVVDYPILLLDEPTASLDAENRSVVITLIKEALKRGSALVGIFHDADVREAVGTLVWNVESGSAA